MGIFQQIGYFWNRGDSQIQKIWFLQQKNLKKKSLDYLEIPWVTIYITQGKNLKNIFFTKLYIFEVRVTPSFRKYGFYNENVFFEKIPWVRKIIKISNPRKKNKK